jgi:excisionase family DNA binding protein
MPHNTRPVDLAVAAQVMTVDQVAAYLQLNRLTVYRYVRDGDIPAARIGKVYRIRREDVDAFLEARKRAAGGAPRREPKGGGGNLWPGRPGRLPRRLWPRAEEIHVGPSWKDRQQDRRSMFPTVDPLEVIVHGRPR